MVSDPFYRRVCTAPDRTIELGPRTAHRTKMNLCSDNTREATKRHESFFISCGRATITAQDVDQTPFGGIRAKSHNAGARFPLNAVLRGRKQMKTSSLLHSLTRPLPFSTS